MRYAVMESILMPAGHEIDFDRLLVEELQVMGHEVCFYVPEQYKFKFDYGVETHYLQGQGVSYAGVGPIGKLIRSFKRELNRWRWFEQLYMEAVRDAFDAVIIPTATYRYLRTLCKSNLRESPVPMILIMHGINPREAEDFFCQARKLLPYKNIKIVVLTLADNILGQTLPNVHCIKPPVFVPRDIEYEAGFKLHEPLRLGFFGQYRKEKNLDSFLDAFISAKLEVPIQLLVQGATAKPDDAADFKRIIEKYKGYPQISFLHKSLIGKEWQQAIMDVDALIMPYSAERYLYHWSAMLFTAIGFYKPVLVAETINPEVLSSYKIGIDVSTLEQNALKERLQLFINTLPKNKEIYSQELIKANNEFAPKKFCKILEAISSH